MMAAGQYAGPTGGHRRHSREYDGPRGGGGGGGGPDMMIGPSGGGPVAGNQGGASGGGGGPTPVLDLKVILTREEVSYLFGFDGVLLAQLRQQTGANIGITDGDPNSTPEYVLCIGGSIDIIFKAFSLVCRKLWDFLCGQFGTNHQRPLTLRLACPSSQCGSIIGKQGVKVKEIRDLTQANIQVSQDALPDSTERSVEISGSGEACLQATYHICTIMQESPIRGELIPYIPPKQGGGFYGNSQQQQQHGMGGPPGPAAMMDAAQWRPVFLCGDRAFVIEGRVARPAPPELLRQELSGTPLGGDVADQLARKAASAANDQLHKQNGDPSTAPDHMNPLALMAAISKSQRAGNGGGGAKQTSREMSVAVELWASGGISSKMEEIQRMSGAQVHVDTAGQQDVLLTMSGGEESVLLAQFLVQSNIDLVMKQRQQTVLPVEPPPQQHQQLGSHAFDMQQQQQQLPPPNMQQQWQPRGGGGARPGRGGGRGAGGGVGGGRRGGRR